MIEQPILIVGLPRSGTTWFAEVLSSAQKTHYVFEPDNEALSPIAWYCKRELHRFPYLTPEDDALDYHRMWSLVFSGNLWRWYVNVAMGLTLRRILKRGTKLEAHIGEKTGFSYINTKMHWVGSTPQIKPYSVDSHLLVAFLSRKLLETRSLYKPKKRLIVKSVHAPLSLEWMSNNFPVKIVVVLRNPYSLYASYKRMNLPDGFRNLFFQPRVQRDMLSYVPSFSKSIMRTQEDPIAFQIMFLYKVITSQLANHPEWTFVSHDRLCIKPHDNYENIYNKLDLQWSNQTGKKIETLNTQGNGFTPKRISKNQPFKWKSDLTQNEQLSIQYWSRVFDLDKFFEENVNVT